MSTDNHVEDMSKDAGQVARAVADLKPLGMVVVDLQDLAAAEARWLPLLNGVRRSAARVRAVADRIRATHCDDAAALNEVAGVLREYVRVTDEGRISNGRPPSCDPSTAN